MHMDADRVCLRLRRHFHEQSVAPRVGQRLQELGKRFIRLLRPAIGRITISSPAVMKPLARLNVGKPYARQLKPFNFLLTCHVRAFGHPEGVDAELFHLIAPWESEPERWTRIDWIDQ